MEEERGREDIGGSFTATDGQRWGSQVSFKRQSLKSKKLSRVARGTESY